MFFLCILDDESALDAMPVVKTTHYPWTDGSYRPLAYLRLASIGNGILVDIQAFERDPDCSDLDELLNNSCVALSLRFAPGQSVLTIVLNADGRCRAYRDGQAFELPLKITRYGGDDEQGWYWGVRFELEETILWKNFSVAKLENEHKIEGNLYKFKRTGSDSHMGSAADMPDESIFSPANLAEFTVLRA